MAANATFGKTGSADKTASSLPAVGRNATAYAQRARRRYSALSSSVISDTDAFASPNSIDVFSP